MCVCFNCNLPSYSAHYIAITVRCKPLPCTRHYYYYTTLCMQLLKTTPDCYYSLRKKYIFKPKTNTPLNIRVVKLVQTFQALGIFLIFWAFKINLW